MISARQCPTSIRDMRHLDLTSPMVHLPHSSIPGANNSLAEESSVAHPSVTAASVNNAFMDDLFSLQSHFCPIIHVGRVATVDRHDTNARTQERKAHNTKLNAVVAPSSLGSTGTISSNPFPTDVARNSSAIMDSRNQGLWKVEQVSATRYEDSTFQSRDSTIPSKQGSGISAWLNAAIGPGSHEDLSEGRRRVGEILVRCGVINVSRTTPTESTAVGHSDIPPSCPVSSPVTSGVTAEIPFDVNRRVLITALADWTSEWVHTFVIQPYLRGSFRFQYQRKSSISSSLALRIRRVLSDMYNPVQVTIHALWFISTLTGNGTHDNVPFLSVPIFRYLHNNGTIIAEDFMFRTFVACAMIGDKTINDATLSTNAWNRLTRIPQATLNATEKYVLGCLKWNVVMTQRQWQDVITYLRSCIKMGSVFDPFTYDEDSPSGIMARYLDKLISLNYGDGSASQQAATVAEVVAPQPIRHFTHWEVFNTTEWCPEDDPVINQKPRIIGIAPGANQNSTTLKVGTTAKDLLDSIIGSNNVPDLAHLAGPAGKLFCGGIGAHFTHTVRIASACQNTSWFSSRR